jgi:hypothetical protein
MTPDEEERRRKADELFELALKALERIVRQAVRDALRRAEWGTMPDEYDPARDPDHPMHRAGGSDEGKHNADDEA